MTTEQLILSVYNRQSLWNASDPDHRNRYILDKLWAEVAQENNVTVRMAQTKWKNLRDYFRRELKKIPVLRGGDLSGDVSDKCHWSQFKSLMFLKDQFEFVPKQSRSNLASLDDNAAVHVFNDSQSQMSTASCGELNDPLEADQSLYTESSHSPTPALSSSNSNQFDKSKTSTVNRGRKRNHIGTLIELEQQKLELLAETKTEQANNFSEDEHQCFFKSLLPHVRRIRNADILEFRNEVQNLVQKYAYPETGTFNYEHNYEIKHSHAESYENRDDCENIENADDCRNYKQEV